MSFVNRGRDAAPPASPARQEGSSRRRRKLMPRLLGLALVTAAAFVALPTTPAHAHGSTIDPASRNYGCWKRWGSDFQNPAMATQDPMCWQAWQADPTAMWNWNGLYIDGAGGNHQAAAPDGQLCSAGGTADGRYRAMDTPGNWVATDVGTNFTVRLHDQALHGADYIRVYVTRQGYNPLTQPLRWADLELRADTGRILPGVGTPESDPVLNGVTMSVPVSAPGRTGRHVVYTIWQASHSDQSYYLCADVNFGGSTTPPPTTPPPTTPPPTTTPPTTPPPTTQPPTTTPVPTTTTVTPTGGTGSCTATYSVLNQWPGGFQAEVQVTAGSAPLTGWAVQWSYADGQTVSNFWSSQITQNGAAVTAYNVSYNGNVPAGGTATFGFLGGWSGTNGVPTLTCTAL